MTRVLSGRKILHHFVILSLGKTLTVFIYIYNYLTFIIHTMNSTCWTYRKSNKKSTFNS